MHVIGCLVVEPPPFNTYKSNDLGHSLLGRVLWSGCLCPTPQSHVFKSNSLVKASGGGALQMWFDVRYASPWEWNPHPCIRGPESAVCPTLSRGGGLCDPEVGSPPDCERLVPELAPPSLQSCEEWLFAAHKPPRLWYFVVAAQTE